MSDALRRVLPWLLVLASLPLGLLVVTKTEDHACSRLIAETGQGQMIEFEPEDQVPFVLSRCTIQWSNGAVREETNLNWIGMLLAGSLLAGAWFLGAGIGGIVRPPVAGTAVALCAGAFILGVTLFFL